MLGDIISDPSVIVITLIVLGSGVLAGAAGFGLPALSVGLLASIHDPRLAIATMICPILVIGLRQSVRFGDWPQTARRCWIISILMVVSLWGTAVIAAYLSAAALVAAIGGALVLFAAASLAKSAPPIADGVDSVAQGIAGLSCGIIGGLTAIWSPLPRIYLLARGVGADDAIRQSNWFTALGAVPLAAAYWQAGLFSLPVALMSLMMCLPAYAGHVLGERIAVRLSAVGLARMVIAGLALLLGINLLREVFV